MADARIVDRGYRPYDGPRKGVEGAVRTLAWHSALRALGLRRSVWSKVFPLLSVAIAYLPAFVFVGMASLVPQELATGAGLLPDYPDYYGFISIAIVIFVALVGPEVLCTDRRDGMLSMYLASPLNRTTYLVAKVVAVLPVLALVTLGPPLLLLVGLTLADAGPSGVGDFLLILIRVILSGIAISTVYTALSLAAASLTDRRAVASAGVILLLLVTSVATVTLVELAASEQLMLLNLLFVPFELVSRIYGEVGAAPGIGTAALVVANLAWALAGGAVVWFRYQRLQVTR